MDSSVAIRRPEFSVATVVALIALLIMFLLGGMSGYLLRAVSGSANSSAPLRGPVAACAPGTHAVVYYTAETWSCVGN